MQYARFYGWPYNRGRDQLATEFYEKAAPGIQSFERREDFSLCLCSNENGLFIFVLVENSQPEDVSAEIGAAVKAYYSECGCSAPDDIEYVRSNSLLSASTIVEALGNMGVTLVRGTTRRSGRVSAIEPRQTQALWTCTLSLEQAIAAVSSRIGQFEPLPEGDEWVVLPGATIERPFGWVVFCGSRLFCQTGEMRYAYNVVAALKRRDPVAGGEAFIVDRRSGFISAIGTTYSVGHYIAEYEARLEQTRP